MVDILLEVLYLLCGLMSIATAIFCLADKEHPTRFGSAIFWGIYGVLFIAGNYIPFNISGILIIVMAILTATKQVKTGNIKKTTDEFRQKSSKEIGNIIFLPALLLGVAAFAVAQFTSLGGLVGVGVGSIIGLIFALIMTKSSPVKSIESGNGMLQQMGSSSILPQILAALGALFSAAGVGEVISGGISAVIPEGNILIGVIVYFLGMAIFTMIMGNAFAAFAVITVGVGAPFVLANGANPAVIGALAMTAGFCGTLMTPMAANFNIVPAALLEMNEDYGVIKVQIPVAIALFISHIILAMFLAF